MPVFVYRGYRSNCGLVMSSKQNLFSGLPALADGEDFVELLRCRNLVIDRILSSG